ncbi:SGNH hydrolase-like domain-containing protein, acetyltransferase AlgX [Lachnospiraceae bacterium]|nr:SGNH hydrolase-like domain-containing protein, acetyltransferase AlgX [Lachnospiraceae bacterium]
MSESSSKKTQGKQNNKNLSGKAFITIFMVIILLPFVGMLFYKTDMSVEKRTAAPFPKLKTYDGKLNLKYFENLNDYFNDHFAFRQEMTTVDATLTTKLLNTSLNDDVIYGKDGWLYYSETMDEYFGRNVLSDRGIHNCAKSIKLMQDYTENQDVQFLFMVAPIKADLYPEHLPDNYKKGSDVNNWSKLLLLMDEMDIHYVNLHDAFHNDNRVMYHKLDTHWNDEGAAFACRTIENAVGRNAKDYTEVPYNVEKVFHGDVYGMLYPKGRVLDDNVVYSEGHSFSYVTNTKDTEDFNIQTSCEGKDGSLVMFRDSYGNALIPFMADEYKDAYFTKIMPFDLDLISEYNADVVMLELTQRHITYLWEYLPKMDAMLTDETPENPEQTEENSILRVEKDTDGRLIVYGTLDPEYTDDSSPVYIRITDSQYISDYEAFPVGYKKVGGEVNLSEEEAAAEKRIDKLFEESKYDKQDYQFGMYISPENLEKGECTFEIITEKDGVAYTSGNIYTYNNN